jgi:hypothetical protein
MWIADLTIRFENGSIGAKQFEARTRDLVHLDADCFLTAVIQYAKAKQKNLVRSHRVEVREA